jgi:hypothetical protein
MILQNDDVVIHLKADLSLQQLRNIINELKVGPWTATSGDIHIVLFNYIDGDILNSFLDMTGM